MTTATMTETQVMEWTQDAYRVTMYRGLFGWTVETQILGDVYTETFTGYTDASAAYTAEVASLSQPASQVEDDDDYEPLTWDC